MIADHVIGKFEESFELAADRCEDLTPLVFGVITAALRELLAEIEGLDAESCA